MYNKYLKIYELYRISGKHLQRYINEFVFRLNEGNNKVLLMDRISSLLSKAFSIMHANTLRLALLCIFLTYVRY